MGPVVWPVRIDPTGRNGPTRGAANGPKWRRSSEGFYVPASVELTSPQRIAEAVPLLPAGGAVTGWAALLPREVAFLDGLRPDGRTQLAVRLLVGPGAGRRTRPGVAFLQDRLDEVHRVRGIPCTPTRRAVFDEMRAQESVREAVVVMDMVAAAEVMSIARMQVYVESRAGWNGVRQVRAALRLADERSASPPESRLRMVWLLDARLPVPLVNRPVFDRHSGHLLGYPDLLDEEAGLVVEYDGDDHRRARRHSSDVGREARFRGVDLEVTRVTSLDLLDRPALVNRLVEARSRAKFLPSSRRAWTLQRPRWFNERPPVDVLLDLQGEPR